MNPSFAVNVVHALWKSSSPGRATETGDGKIGSDGKLSYAAERGRGSVYVPRRTGLAVVESLQRNEV